MGASDLESSEVEGGAILQIGEVAERVGLSLRTIRHWDEVGLVSPSKRTSGGFRLYSAADVERLAFVKLLKPLEFRIDEIRDLLDTLDRVVTGEDHDVMAAAADRLESYVSLAEQRCRILEEQLISVNGVAASLRAHVRRARGDTRE